MIFSEDTSCYISWSSSFQAFYLKNQINLSNCFSVLTNFEFLLITAKISLAPDLNSSFKHALNPQQGTLTIAQLNKTTCSGHFEASYNGVAGNYELKGDFKNVPLKKNWSSIIDSYINRTNSGFYFNPGDEV